MINRTLNYLKEGETATVCNIEASGNIRRRLLDIGLVKGTKVECIQRSPLGDPVAYLIRGSIIALRSEDSKKVIIGMNE